MKLLAIGSMRVFWLSLVSIAFFSSPVHPQRSAGMGVQSSTEERIDTESWWPTKPNVALDKFAGSAACSRCHGDESTLQSPTSMQRAATAASNATFLARGTSIKGLFPPLTYSLSSTAAGLQYSVADKSHKVTRDLDWVMGAGDLAHTFLYQSEGRWYQSKVSTYTALSTLDITPGLTSAKGADLARALGDSLTPDETRRCFSCHTVHSASLSGFNPVRAEPGLGCEACHGPGFEHVDAMEQSRSSDSKGNRASLAKDMHIFNPASLSPTDSIDFCGACHRTFVDVTLSMGQAMSTAIVRFQPYRLEESRCWQKTQSERLTCVACHDPHQRVNRDVFSYDKNCLGCHGKNETGGAMQHASMVCPRATSHCVSCHMPKVAVESMHGEFTDHLIRVVRAGDQFPR